MVEAKDKRLRVEKNINKKATMLFGLSFGYFFVLVFVFLLSMLFLIDFSKVKLLVVLVFNALGYLVIKYLDSSKVLDDFSFKQLPKYLDNDLYRLRYEKDCKIVRKSSHTKS
ncbi:hypothetical protein ACILDU_11220 [Capnocytophaga canimorsus]|uniref:hypothetical protein n=1 Tax=Capnocytophaga canimorsus TaxID=28188 RepID=UPI0037D7C743